MKPFGANEEEKRGVTLALSPCTEDRVSPRNGGRRGRASGVSRCRRALGTRHRNCLGRGRTFCSLIRCPLPPGVDAGAFAFDETTRLPPCAQLAQFVAAKDAARARAHAEIERAARGALVRAIEAPLLPPLSSSGRLGGRAMGTGAAAGAGAAARAATLAHNVVWRVRAEELLPAGPEFVTAMRDAGWDARVGEEDGVFEFEARNLAIGDAVNLYFRALRVKGEALPAGEIANGAPRAGWKAKVAGWICDLGMHIVPIVHVAGTQGKGAVQCFFVFVAVGYVLRWATA